MGTDTDMAAIAVSPPAESASVLGKRTRDTHSAGKASQRSRPEDSKQAHRKVGSGPASAGGPVSKSASQL